MKKWIALILLVVLCLGMAVVAEASGHHGKGKGCWRRNQAVCETCEDRACAGGESCPVLQQQTCPMQGQCPNAENCPMQGGECPGIENCPNAETCPMQGQCPMQQSGCARMRQGCAMQSGCPRMSAQQ